MKKLNQKQIKEITGKLKPFWEKRCKLWADFRDKEAKIEKEMTKEINLGIDLEFFYVDGEAVGIGAVYDEDRKKFPLIHDGKLDFN